LAPEVAAHAAAVREREQREREQQRAAQMAASDGFHPFHPLNLAALSQAFRHMCRAWFGHALRPRARSRTCGRVCVRIFGALL
jgi:hypothetical protein